MQTLRWCLSASFFKKSYGVFPILFMSRRLRYLLRVYSTWQKPCSGKYVVGNASNSRFAFLQSFGRVHCIWFNNTDCITALDVDETSWMVKSHSLVLVANQGSHTIFKTKFHDIPWLFHDFFHDLCCTFSMRVEVILTLANWQQSY